jgi:hypothetical protein
MKKNRGNINESTDKKINQSGIYFDEFVACDVPYTTLSISAFTIIFLKLIF